MEILNLFPALMAKITFKWKIQNTLTLLHMDLEITAAKHSPPDVALTDVPARLKPNFLT